MKIAFASCFSAVYFRQQPIWTEIAAARPDVLVLLGDSVYHDVSGLDTASIKGMSEADFANHARGLFKKQAEVAEFKALVQQPQLTTYAIWDDHDFLWNDACGGDVAANPLVRDLVYPSRAVFGAWRTALANKLAGDYPKTPPWTPRPPEPGYTHVMLEPKLMLHLTDGRSFRKGRGKTALLGKAQLDQMEAAMAAAPAGTTHLVASGSVFDRRGGDAWLNCPAEYNRMLQWATRFNILILSGDIHDYNLTPISLAGGRMLYDATASGAALKTGVFVGAERRNYGLLTIDPAALEVEIFSFGKREKHVSIDRASWQPVA